MKNTFTKNVKLKELVEFVSGFAFKSEKFNSDRKGLPLVRIRDVTRGYSETYIDGPYEERFIIKNGDYLIGMDGEFNLSKWNGGRALLNQRVCKLGNVSEKLDRDYLARFLPDALKRIEDSTPFVTVKHLSIRDLAEISIPLPPIKEQKRIADILDKADALRAKRRESITLMNSLTQSIFLEMFGDPRFKERFKMEELGSHIDVLTDYHANGSYEILRKHVQLHTEKNFALMVRTTDLEHNEFDKNVNYIDEDAYNFLAKSKVFGGEIIINKIGSAGNIYLMPKLNRPVSLGMNAFMLRLKPTVSNIYIYHSLISDYGKSIIQKHVKGAVTKTITKDAVRSLQIPIPPIKLQHEFAERINKIEKIRLDFSRHNELVKSAFLSIQQRSFSGGL